jgi:hypothetical protein
MIQTQIKLPVLNFLLNPDYLMRIYMVVKKAQSGIYASYI